MKILDIPQVGKIGQYVVQGGRYGQIKRAYVIPMDPKTPIQLILRRNLTRVTQSWRTLTQEERDFWTALALTIDSVPHGGTQGHLSGMQLYSKINCINLLCGNPIAVLPVTDRSWARALPRRSPLPMPLARSSSSSPRSVNRPEPTPGSFALPRRRAPVATSATTSALSALPPPPRTACATSQPSSWPDMACPARAGRSGCPSPPPRTAGKTSPRSLWRPCLP
jgi:hypothetical protein